MGSWTLKPEKRLRSKQERFATRRQIGGALDPREGQCAACYAPIQCKLRGECGAANCTVSLNVPVCNCWQYRRSALTGGWKCPLHGQQW